MTEPKICTKFLPAEKAEPAEVARQHKMLMETSLVADALNGMLNFTLILNPQRQVVFVNKAYADFLKERGMLDPIGQRPGNLAGCTHATETEGGCGTTESCRYCGAAQALAAALGGSEAVKECRIMTRISGEELDLRVQARPFKCNGEDFLLMSLVDISSEKRRQVFDRLFFHDILNTAGGLQGLLSLMDGSSAEEMRSYVPTAAQASDRLVDQILSQKDLAAAERGDLHPKAAAFPAAAFLEEIAALFRAHEVGKGMQVAVKGDCGDLILTTDRTLLARVIGNLVKNALEAEQAGAAVTLSCLKTDGGAALTVHNPRQMPDAARLQVFQRSFTTKGEGRGLGTYSVRLLTEKYLKGKASFATGPSGTEFRVELPGMLR